LHVLPVNVLEPAVIRGEQRATDVDAAGFLFE
jgi:hypothetical protein